MRSTGAYYSASGQWVLSNAEEGIGGLGFYAADGGDPLSFVFGAPGGIPVVGDWDGDGDDTIGWHVWC